jgi:uncharacterized OB-fold protein
MNNRAAIVPDAEGLAAVYWDGVQQERLLLQRCTPCGHVWHPPSEFCPSCQASDFEWIEASGDGVIHSYTVVHHAVHVAVEPWIPYTILLVDLSEGARVIGRLLDAPGDPGIGAPVCLRFERYSNLKVPAFGLGSSRTPGDRPGPIRNT